MSTAPGWYPLPNEPGMMGYWNGTGWTGHKQPLPPAQETLPVSVQAPAEAPVPHYPAAVPGGQAQQPWAPESLFGSAKKFIGDPNVRANGTAAAGGALIADGVVGFGEKRQGIGGAIGTVLFGIVWLFLTLGPGMPLSNAEPRPGTVHAQATVANVQVDSKGNCTPVAQLQVAGKQYSVHSSVSQKPCPYMKGDSIDVTYHPDDIQATATIPPTGFFKTFLTFAPWIGVLAIVIGVWTFIKRAGSIAAGIVLLVKGLRARKELKENAGQ